MINRTTAALLACLIAAPVAAQEMNAEEVLSEAQGYLHLTCNTVVKTHGTDEDKMLDIVGLMIAVSLNNRQIDFTTLNLSDAEVTEIRSEFAEQIGNACAHDADQLLAGIVDGVVAELVLYY